MFTNDYFMRMIELLVLGIARIMGLKQQNRQEEAAELLSGTLRKFFGLSDSAVEELPWEDLMNVVSLGGAPDMERCALMGQLIKEKADLTRMKGGAVDSAALYGKALNLLLIAVLDDERLFNETNLKYIDEIVALMDNRELSEAGRRRLMRYYEAAGRFGKAEDVLFDLLQSAGNPEEIEEMGLAFYRRLLLLSDAALWQGNLPRNEVMEGYRRLAGSPP